MGATVYAFTTSTGKEEFIKKLGASHVVTYSDTDLKGFNALAGQLDVVVNTNSATDPNIINSYLSVIRPEGTLI